MYKDWGQDDSFGCMEYYNNVMKKKIKELRYSYRNYNEFKFNYIDAPGIAGITKSDPGHPYKFKRLYGENDIHFGNEFYLFQMLLIIKASVSSIEYCEPSVKIF